MEMKSRKSKSQASKKKEFEAYMMENEIKRARGEAIRAGAPTRQFQPGEQVRYGGWERSVILECCEGGLYYKVESHSPNPRPHEPEKASVSYVPWYNLNHLKIGESNFSSNEDIRLRYYNSSIESLLNKHYLSGVDFNPEYQRGLVWTDAEREALLESIFMGADIGRFVFRVKNDDEVESWEDPDLEIVDGKQRMTTLLHFYEGRFPYRGVYYPDLSPMDKRRIRDASVSIAEVRNLKRKDVLRLFLLLNRSGKPMEERNIERVRLMLDEEIQKETHKQ